MSADVEQVRVVLVGVEDTSNLGLRILLACLRRAGISAALVPLGDDAHRCAATVAKRSPAVVGLSWIFQNMTPQFRETARALREVGVTAHLTAGGHYPTFAYERILRDTPEIDSIVQFEGEQTLVELATSIERGRDWRSIEGIAFRADQGVRCTPVRAGVTDLDQIPWPDRDDLSPPSGPLPSASLLGSRGCPHGCSFCSIAPFYRNNGTPGRRYRDPSDVADEMEWLYRRGACALLFQDDDFLGGGKRGCRWAHNLAAEIVRRRLHERIRFRIACRSDEVRDETMRPLVEAGLAHVYLGVESGAPAHLDDLAKGLTAETHLRAGRVLRDLKLSFDAGFMLMTPWSTFDTIRENLAFLREFSADGAVSVGFCRTLPYAGTPIADRLSAEGRLGTGYRADYHFLDPRLDALWDWLYQTFNHRNQHPEGTRNLLGMLMYEASIRLPEHPFDLDHRERLRAITATANQVMLDAVEAAVDHTAAQDAPPLLDDPFLAWLADHHAAQDARLRAQLVSVCEMRANILPHRESIGN